MDLSPIPSQQGIYLILNPTAEPPILLAKGVGGYHKERDPNISVPELSSRWVTGCRVLYIGKAGGITFGATLKNRLRQYLEFGKGKAAGHYGGRLIWQLQHHSALLVAWKVIVQSDPREEERTLIKDFYDHYGRLPFANVVR